MGKISLSRMAIYGPQKPYKCMSFRWLRSLGPQHCGPPQFIFLDTPLFVVESNIYNTPGIESYVSYPCLAGRTSNSEGRKAK